MHIVSLSKRLHACVYVVANYTLRPPKMRAYRRMETVKFVSAADTRTYFYSVF